MKRQYTWLRVAGLLAARAAGEALAEDESEPSSVRGIDGRVAVYAVTNTPREAVAWLSSDTVLTLPDGLSDDPWLRIEPPEAVSVWIYRELVRDGQVLADKSQVRAGAGMAYRPVASLDRGTRVEVRGIYGDWLKIKPPPDVGFWVLRDQVEPLAELPTGEAAEASGSDLLTGILVALTNETSSLTFTNSAPAMTAPQPAAPLPAALPAKARVQPPELAGYVLEETEGQGEHVLLKGTLDWGGIGAVSAPFSLVARQPDGDTEPVCHLLVPELTYGPRIGASVTVEGTRWRVRGSRLPFVIPHTVRFDE